MPTPELTITHAELRDDLEKKEMSLLVRLHNPGPRTLHAYASIRALRYDPATKTLEVQLSDRGLREPGLSGNFPLPKFTSIDPNGEATLELTVPRTIARLKPGHGQIAPIVEEFPAHEAENVTIEVAYAGTPFYRDPRAKIAKTPRKMMQDWAEGHARHTLRQRRETTQ